MKTAAKISPLFALPPQKERVVCASHNSVASDTAVPLTTTTTVPPAIVACEATVLRSLRRRCLRRRSHLSVVHLKFNLSFCWREDGRRELHSQMVQVFS